MSFNIFLKSGKKQCVKIVNKNVQMWVEKWIPEIAQSEIAGLRHFLPSTDVLGILFWFLVFFGGLLGALLGILRLSWEASGPKNV